MREAQTKKPPTHGFFLLHFFIRSLIGLPIVSVAWTLKPETSIGFPAPAFAFFFRPLPFPFCFFACSPNSRLFGSLLSLLWSLNPSFYSASHVCRSKVDPKRRRGAVWRAWTGFCAPFPLFAFSLCAFYQALASQQSQIFVMQGYASRIEENLLGSKSNNKGRNFKSNKKNFKKNHKKKY